MTRILPVADMDLLVETKNLKTSIIEELIYPPKHRSFAPDYGLQLLPLSIQDKEVVFSIQFWAKYKGAEGDKKNLLNQAFRIAQSRMLIIGFPTNDSSGRGTVYWLTLYLEK